MVKCKRCKKVITIGQPFIKLQFIGDFCNEDCVNDFIKCEIKKFGISYIKEQCGHCFNCRESTENSMFGSNTKQKCKVDESIDCEDVEQCSNFMYGEPEKYTFTYNRDGGKEFTVEAIKYIRE